MTSLFTDPQEKPLAKFLRVTMALPGGRTRQLREEAKAEYEQLLADSARMRVLLETATELKGRSSR
jgi:hypothetical protein